MRSARKALAASFVVTFVAGCDSKATQPPATPTVDVGPSPAAASGASSATAAPSASSPAAPVDSSAAATLPPAPSVGRINRQADGTCMWFAPPPQPRQGGNGRMIPMNPPAPHLVQCPPGDGGT
jgi:hypothetical protein